MKVLMTTDTVGGVWHYALELARSLAPLGVRVELATLGAPLSPDQRRQVAALANVTVHESRYRLIWQQDPWADVEAAGRWLLDLARRLKPDLVHLNDYPFGALPWQVPVLAVGHSCVLSWWRAVRGEPAPPEWHRYREAVRRSLAGAHRVVAPTRAMLDGLNHDYGPLPQGQVIHNGRDGFVPGDKQALILAAGRLWDEAKNIATLAGVAPALAWPVVVAGDAIHPEGGTARFDNVQTLGSLPPEQLAPWFARAGIYALPARYEPFGLTVLEAARAGCALVLGDIPSLRELWSDAARFVPPDDRDALRHELNTLIHDAALRREYARRARQRSRHYTSQAMAQAYYRVYRALRDCGDTAVPSRLREAL